MISYKCRTAQNGYAAGRAFVIRSHHNAGYSRSDPGSEISRLEEALTKLQEKLCGYPEQPGTAGSDVIGAQLLILQDEDFINDMRRGIREEGLSAPDAVALIVKRRCMALADSRNGYISERCADLRGLSDRLRAIITGMEHRLPDSPVILAGTELSPTDIALTDPGNILGILTEHGSATSHVAVLAGSLGVPYMYGLHDITVKVHDEDMLILDTETSSVLINPPEDDILQAYERKKLFINSQLEKQRRSAVRKTMTRICANIARPEETDGLIDAGADGIGLFRSEFVFLNRDDPPSEDEQYEAYRHAAETMKGRETVIRTMDLGTDKTAPWLPLDNELNPALGLRGIRLSLKYRRLFRTQLCAILRAAGSGNIRVTIPMVSSLREVDETIKEIGEAAKELDKRGEAYKVPPLGVMIETPAAVMIASELAGKVSFFSIGTNDLTQYSLAMDRESCTLDLYPYHDKEEETGGIPEAVMRMIELTVKAAHENDIHVSVCGELAWDPQAAGRLVSMGVDGVSVSPAKLGQVRDMIADAEENL